MSYKISANITRFPLPAAKSTRVLDKAPLGRRLGAYGADWFAGDLFAAFPVAIVYSIVTGKTEITDRITDVPGICGLLAGILCLCFIFLYYVFIPWKVWNGQTLGKRLFGIRITAMDGSKANLRQLLLRQAAGLMILENGLLPTGHFLGELAALAGMPALFIGWWGKAGLAVGIISGILVAFSPHRRGLHDSLAGTRVIPGENGIGQATKI